MERLPKLLLPWYKENQRILPWRQDREPYHVWLSEIMLQQTRVEAVKSYYARFLSALPNIESLANASEEQCRKLWEGLGYYSRVRNLQKAAKEIMVNHNGAFPADYCSVRALPGIGDYTAGAVCSICFNLPTAAVDGNVVRVLTRFLKDSRPFTDMALRKELKQRLEEVYPKNACGDFTQALMELGATVCVPNGVPRCDACPLRDICRANLDGCQGQYPVRSVKKPRRVEQHTVFILRCGEEFALSKRPSKGLLADLWQFPNVKGHLSAQEALLQAEAWGAKPLAPEKVTHETHIFTHVEWQMRGVYITCSSMPDIFTWAGEDALEQTYALPTAFRRFLK